MEDESNNGDENKSLQKSKTSTSLVNSID